MLAANHPVWKLLRYIVVGTILIVGCSTLYRSGFDPKDVVLIVTTVAGLAGYDQIKKKATEE